MPVLVQLCCVYARRGPTNFEKTMTNIVESRSAARPTDVARRPSVRDLVGPLDNTTFSDDHGRGASDVYLATRHPSATNFENTETYIVESRSAARSYASTAGPTAPMPCVRSSSLRHGPQVRIRAPSAPGVEAGAVNAIRREYLGLRSS